jgi:hypothetical protein
MLGVEMKVVGVSFEGRQNHLDKIDSRTPVSLIREPNNPHDKSAIAVVRNDNGVKLGYISRKFNVPLAKLLDKGTELKARIKRTVSAQHTDMSGLVIVIEKKEN